MTEYKKGQRVKVEFEGVIEWVSSDGHIRLGGNAALIDTERSGSLVHMRSLDFVGPDRHFKITLLDPQGWPPRKGDIWKADGEEYFAAESGKGIILMRSSVGTNRELGYFKTLDPVLVRRRGE